MERRKFLFGFLGFTTVASAQIRIEDQTIRVFTNDPNFAKFNGWKIEWTGWKYSADNLELHGQWLAWDKTERRYFYQDSGGRGSNYNPGDMLYTQVTEARRQVFFNTTEEFKESVKTRTLKELEETLEGLGDGGW